MAVVVDVVVVVVVGASKTSKYSRARLIPIRISLVCSSNYACCSQFVFLREETVRVVWSFHKRAIENLGGCNFFSKSIIIFQLFADEIAVLKMQKLDMVSLFLAC